MPGTPRVRAFYSDHCAKVLDKGTDGQHVLMISRTVFPPPESCVLLDSKHVCVRTRVRRVCPLGEVVAES